MFKSSTWYVIVLIQIIVQAVSSIPSKYHVFMLKNVNSDMNVYREQLLGWQGKQPDLWLLSILKSEKG